MNKLPGHEAICPHGPMLRAAAQLHSKPRCLLAVGCVLILLAYAAAAFPASKPTWTEVSGFRVDMRRTSEPLVAETLENLQYQIGIVEAANLPKRILSFFRTVRLVVDPSLTGMNGQYIQVDGQWVVRARPGQWPPGRAILLHELLHAYHHQVLGQPTSAINRAYDEALREGTYPDAYRNTYFLSNPREFFAVIGEIYLSGASFRPPFNCGTVQEAQPDFIKYLGSLFGERPCTK